MNNDPQFLDNLATHCDVCPRHCKMKPGQRGFCWVRENQDGRVVSTTYGRTTGLALDPVEKKPLYQFYPGSSVLSFGTPGCNLGCQFCQNWTMSRSHDDSIAAVEITPREVAELAAHHKCRSVAYTYNDPVIWHEYAEDCALECRQRGIKNIAVTAGYISPEPRKRFFTRMDAANIDLKSMRPEFYRKYSRVDLEPVLDTLRYVRRETNVWLEVTNLLIPPGPNSADDGNDSPGEIELLCDWIVENLGEQTPLHFSAFHPAYKMSDRPSTPFGKLVEAYRIAHKAGLKYVYLGNVRAWQYESTYCPHCNKLVLHRDGYRIVQQNLMASPNDPAGPRNRCVFCQTSIAGVF